MKRTGFLLLLILAAPAPSPAAPFTAQSTLDQQLVSDTVGAALAFMAPRTLEEIPVPQMALWGLRGLAALDPRLAPSLEGADKTATLRLTGPPDRELLARPAPPATDAASVVVDESRGVAAMAETDTTPFGSCWQRTEPSSPMMRMADPGAQVPVMRACLPSSAWAFLTISSENVSSDLPTSSGMRSMAILPVPICAASMTGACGWASVAAAVGGDSARCWTATQVAPAATSAPSRTSKAMRQPVTRKL